MAWSIATGRPTEGIDQAGDDLAAIDGLHGDEGTFAICTFWLVDCLIFLERLR